VKLTSKLLSSVEIENSWSYISNRSIRLHCAVLN